MLSIFFDVAKIHYLFRNNGYEMLNNIKYSGNVCTNQDFVCEIVQSSILFCNFTPQKQ